MKIALIDNHDSFTYNIVHIIRQFSNDFTIFKNDTLQLAALRFYDKIILSPGPKTPWETPQLIDIISEFYATKPLLGICLGHQAIAHYFGAKLINTEKVFHGIQSTIQLQNIHYIFEGIEKTTSVGRYHSWLVDKNALPDCLEVLATDEENNIMAIAHTDHNVVGIQFHPESILTPQGNQMLQNFITK